MPIDTAPLLSHLDSFDLGQRQAALAELVDALAAGRIARPPARDWLNCHCHSCYSYNGYGASPSRLVWEAVQRGLSLVGLVDFDVLDGVDEFHAAGRLLGIRTTAAIETRVFIPELASEQINSPGEPGVAYHMGAGFVTGTPHDPAFLADLAARTRARNLAVLAAVNAHLDPLRLDYEGEVLPLTPAGNATERHLCQAYRAAAERRFPDPVERAAFWQAHLGTVVDAVLADPARLEGIIRAKTMKQGGVGYQQPDSDSFPTIQAMNAWLRGEGVLPMLAWLDGTRSGEADVERLLDLHQSLGTVAVAIVPDRNWNLQDPQDRARKVAELERFVAACETRHLPIMVGTELNAPGLKWVDDFDAPELAGVVDAFRRGAEQIYGHQVAMALGETVDTDQRARDRRLGELAAAHPVLPG